MRIRIVAFARLRELLEASERSLELPDGARAGDAWNVLVRGCPPLADQRGSTRLAVNGRIAPFETTLADGDELALFPPVGGG
jgi:molybdopterin converting factor subunit 1